MRLDQLYPSAQEMTVKMPDGTETDIKLKLVGYDSKQFHATVTRHTQDRQGRVEDPTVMENQKNNAELMASLIAGWTGLEDAGGALPYSHEKAVELMMTPEFMFIREQVEAFAAKRTNFFRAEQPKA